MHKDEFLSKLAERQLIRESRWMRVYRLGDRGSYHESKFATDSIEVAPDDFRREWASYTHQEKRAFAEAYSTKPKLTEDDFQILRHVMEFGSDEIWGWLALRLTELPERDRVFAFLIERIQSDTEYFPNYVQAMKMLGDSRATAVLAERFEYYKLKFSNVTIPLTGASLLDSLKYLYCCSALVKLGGSSAAKAALDAMKGFPNEELQAIAKQLGADTE